MPLASSAGHSTSTGLNLANALARINPARFAGMVDPRRMPITEAAADTASTPGGPGTVVAGHGAARTYRLPL